MAEERGKRFAPRFPKITSEEARAAIASRMAREQTSDNPEAGGRGLHAADWTVSGEVICGRCNNVGYLRADVPSDHPRFGKPSECPCGIVDARRRRTIWESAELPPAFQRFSLDAYVALTGKTAVVDDLRAWQESDRWLLLIGEVGVGKTGLAVSLLAEWLKDGKHGLYVVTPDFLSRIRATYGRAGGDVDELEVLGSVISAPLLVLDDLGTVTLTDWGKEKLFTLINQRMLKGLRTIVTTNLQLEATQDGEESLPQHIGARTWDRIRGQADVMVLTGESLRGRAV